MERVACFIDGFNLYHAIARLGQPHLKWVDLCALAERYVRPRSQRLEAVHYFSAYAEWLPAACDRHAAFIAAQRARGVRPVMGRFKRKDRWCPLCRGRSVGHEEKETDVNIALHLLDGAYRDEFDRALLVSRDSDLTPAMRLLRERFPGKGLTLVAPPLAGHSTEMLRWCTGRTKIRLEHLAGALLPAVVLDSEGRVVATRPRTYSPTW